METDSKLITNIVEFNDDRTPEGFKLTKDGYFEKFIKKPVRRFAYPVYNAFTSYWLAGRFQRKCSFPVDLWLWGQRGNDYERNRRRVNSILPLKGKDGLVAGCGLGYDVPSWASYPFHSLTCIDYFNFEQAWKMHENVCRKSHKNMAVKFEQKDLENLKSYSDESFDLIVSDAVFEHVRDLGKVLLEFNRILRPGGVIYATFGPLWYCWHGDHVSGLNKNEDGYNHLILNKDDYKTYLESLDMFADQQYDPRLWINNGLFSYLSPEQYINHFKQAGFNRLFTAAIIDPRAIRCLRENQGIWEKLLKQHNELDLIMAGMTIICSKP